MCEGYPLWSENDLNCFLWQSASLPLSTPQALICTIWPLIEPKSWHFLGIVQERCTDQRKKARGNYSSACLDNNPVSLTGGEDLTVSYPGQRKNKPEIFPSIHLTSNQTPFYINRKIFTHKYQHSHIDICYTHAHKYKFRMHQEKVFRACKTQPVHIEAPPHTHPERKCES